MLDLSEQLMHNTNDTNTKLLQTLCIGGVFEMWMCWTFQKGLCLIQIQIGIHLSEHLGMGGVLGM